MPSSLQSSLTLVSDLPIKAIASRIFAGVIVNGRPPVRPRARAEARPAIVRSEVQDSRHGWKVLGWSGVGFDFVAQEEVGAGVSGLGGGEVLAQLCDGRGSPLRW